MTCAQGLLRLLWGGAEVGVLRDCLHAHTNIMTTNFLFLPVAVLLFTFPPLKPRTLKHPNQIYANKRIRLWSKNHTLVSAPSIGRFFLPIMIEPFFPFFFFVNCVSI